VLAHAEHVLGREGYAARTVAPSEVRDWYRAADVFALTSTTEGFGLVLLEAMAEGLPCIAHDYPTTRFVLGDEGHLADVLAPGAVTAPLSRLDGRELDEEPRRRRRAWVSDNFSWQALRPRYAELLQRAAGQR
jgi:glycosyltransferase involved in cell wall biosynthesis